MWAIISVAAKEILTAAKQQGFSIMLLLLACAGLVWFIMNERTAREASDRLLRQEIQSCQNQIIEYYRQDRADSDRIILQNTEVMRRNSEILERLESKLR